MKTTLWANCPKCQTELKIETDEPELVQIECPDCHKVFAAKVPPQSAAPMHDVFSQMAVQVPMHVPAQMPVLPPFQPAQVHYKSRPKSSDGSLSPAALTVLITVCASAILLPLGLGGYYFYSQLDEAPQLAVSTPVNIPVNIPVVSAPNSISAPSSFSTPPASGSAEPVAEPVASPNEFSAHEFSAQSPAGRKTPPPSETVGANSTSTAMSPPGSMTPADAASTSDADSKIFGVPELNPPMIVQSDPSSPSTTTPPMPVGNTNLSQGQVSVAGPGMSKSGLPVPLHRFVGSNGVLIFVLHPKGHSVGSAIQELQRTLSISEIHADGGSDYTTIGIRYSGSVDSVVKSIRFGQISYADEESRSIHVQTN
ncbi:MAG: hypothetical protein SFV81_09730 [Pirellulaceae bacterium]|nr:hypothetical protein [Pirellulaceae bacterium]